MNLKEFTEKIKTEKTFKKSIMKRYVRLFCEFVIFKNSKFLKRMLRDNYPVFPLDAKKIPYCLKDQFSSYDEYL